MQSKLSALALFLATARAWTPYTRGKWTMTHPTVRTKKTDNTDLVNATSTKRWLPNEDKIRGVNLGSQFIIEPWMATDTWAGMGCGGRNDEWTCVEALGQDAADEAFRKHWDTWTTREDIDLIASLGLNTIRIPVGFWIREDLVNDGEHYPRGGLEFLDRLVGWAKDAGLYVIMDLHGGPGSQTPNQQFTGHVRLLAYLPASIKGTNRRGQGVEYPEFYNQENYERALKFLEWMADRIHTNQAYHNVGMLQVMNEPVHSSEYPSEAADMIAKFYPQAYERIRAAEANLNVSDGDRLHIQYMVFSPRSSEYHRLQLKVC
jgi:aryl-phospho-beta-D-glucosidase BglC (GH1 family)